MLGVDKMSSREERDRSRKALLKCLARPKVGATIAATHQPIMTTSTKGPLSARAQQTVINQEKDSRPTPKAELKPIPNIISRTPVKEKARPMPVTSSPVLSSSPLHLNKFDLLPKTFSASNYPIRVIGPWGEEPLFERTCSKKGCRARLPPSNRFKTCDVCREKGREKNREFQERKRTLALLQSQASDPMDGEDAENDLPVEERLKNWLKKLRAAGKLPLAARPNEKDDYVEEASGKRKVAEGAAGGPSEAKRPKLDASVAEETSFQSVNDLCHALRKYVRRLQTVAPVPDFRACYTIVAGEDAEITEKKALRAAQTVIDGAKVPVT